MQSNSIGLLADLSVMVSPYAYENLYGGFTRHYTLVHGFCIFIDPKEGVCVCVHVCMCVWYGWGGFHLKAFKPRPIPYLGDVFN